MNLRTRLFGDIAKREAGEWLFFLGILYWLYQHYVVNGYPIVSRRRFQYVFGVKPGYKGDADRTIKQGIVDAKLAALAYNLQMSYSIEQALDDLKKKYTFSRGATFKFVDEMVDRWVAGKKMRFNTSRRLAESMGYEVRTDHRDYLIEATK